MMLHTLISYVLLHVLTSKCERIGMNCEEMTLDGTIEPLAIYSARMVTNTTNLLPK